MIYARRASPLHAAQPVAGQRLVRRAGGLRAGLRPPARARRAARRGGRRRAGRATSATGWRAPPGSRCRSAIMWLLIEPLVLRDGLTVIARLGERAAVRPHRRHARGVGRRRDLRAARGGRDPRLRPLRRRRRPRRGAAAVPPPRPALGADRHRRHADGRRARARRAAAGRRPALPRDRRGRRALQVVRTVAGGALDRALDVSAALELRGYGARPARRRPATPAPWSRHDLAFAASAVALVALLVLGEAGGAAAFDWAPRLHGARARRRPPPLAAGDRARRAGAVRRPPGDRAMSDARHPRRA